MAPASPIAAARLALPRLELEACPCAFCGGTDFMPLAKHDRHDLGLRTVGCRSCGLVQSNPRPRGPALDAFYELHYRRLYAGIVEPDEAYVKSVRKNVRMAYTARRLAAELPLSPSTRLLDFGCGEGSLFVALREAGFQGTLLGVEPDPQFGRYAAERGGAQVWRTLPEAVAPVDAIVMIHVLEHLEDPRAMLCALRARLKADGRLWLDVPDVEAYRSPADLHVAHLLHFSRRTLAALVEGSGYRVVHCERHAPPHHPVSVRLLAAPAAAGVASCTDASTERGAFDVLRRIERRAWRWRLSRRWRRWRDMLRKSVRRVRA